MGAGRTAGGLVACALLLVLVPAMAAANPVPPGDIDLTRTTDIMLLISLNFITNIFLFSALFLASGLVWRQNIGRPDPDCNRFVLRTLAAIFAVTLAGSLIDLATLYTAYEYSDTMLVLRFDALRWGAGLVLVFVSVALAAWKLLGIRRRVSILLGFGMAAANLAFWHSRIGHYGDPGALPLLFLFITPFLLLGMRRWHRMVLPAEGAAPPQAAPEEQPPAAAEAAAGGPAEVPVDDIEKAVDALDG